MRLSFVLSLGFLFVGNAHGTSLPCARLVQSLESPASRDSIVGISVVEGPMVNFWSRAGSEVQDETHRLQLDPDNPVILGRMEGGRPPYLAEGYSATTVLPQGGQVTGRGDRDRLLSRAHFMLKASARGILVVNGVPGHDGRLRAPINAVFIVRPLGRALAPGEAFLIETGTSARVLLPNGTVLLLNAEPSGG